MSSLGLISMGMGFAACLLGVPCLMNPVLSRRLLLAFPRNKVAGWLLTAISLGWAVWLLWNTPLGRFEELKSLTIILAPIAYILIVLCMDELLAARALGACLIMGPAPILAVARLHDSPMRLLVVGLAYVAATAGIALVLSPHLLRRCTSRICRVDGACRACGAALTAVGLALAALALTVY